MADESHFAQLAEVLLPLFLTQVPPQVRDRLLQSDGVDEWRDNLDEMDDVLVFRVYGEGERVILLLVADGGDVDDYQLVLGAFCQGSC